MSDTINEPLELDVDLSQVDTSLPTLKNGLYELEILGFVKEQNKEQTGYNIVMTLANAYPIDADKTLNNRPIAQGKIKLKQWMALQSKDGSEDWKRNFAALQEAALGAKQTTLNFGDLVGRKVVASVKEDTYNDQPTNKIGRLTAVQ